MGDRDSGVKRSRRWSAFPILAAAAACLTFASSAPASTLGSSGGNITYNAIAGEANQLTVKRTGDNIVVAETGGVTITPSLPCSTLLPGNGNPEHLTQPSRSE